MMDNEDPGDEQKPKQDSRTGGGTVRTEKPSIGSRR